MLTKIVERIFLTGSSVRWALQKPIVEHLLGEKLGVTLDIGCGGGMYALEYLPSHSKEVYGVEINKKYLNYLQKNRKANTFFIRANAENLPFRKEVFETVLCTEVIEHLENDEKAINEIKRVLKNNGSLILSTPHPPTAYPDRLHIREGYTIESLENLLQGFEIINSEYCIFSFCRLLLKFRWYFRKLFHFSPPILPLVYIERWKKLGNPFDIIVKAKK